MNPDNRWGGTGARALGWFLLACAGGCMTVKSYEPLRMPLPDLPIDQVFVRVRDTLHERFQRLAVADAESFRLQSAWVAHFAAGRTGQRRATIFREGSDLCLVVEVRYLIEDLFGPPSWTPIGADPVLERDLLDALRAALRVGFLVSVSPGKGSQG